MIHVECFDRAQKREESKDDEKGRTKVQKRQGRFSNSIGYFACEEAP